MTRLGIATGILLSAGVCSAAPVQWAATIVTPGIQSNGWTGQVLSNAGYYSGSGSYTLTPFDAAFTTTLTTANGVTYPATLLAVAPGDSVELGFGSGGAVGDSSINGGFTIGIHAGVGLNDSNYPNGQTYNINTNPTSMVYTNPREAFVAISQDGSTWKYLQYDDVTGDTPVEPNPTNPSDYKWVSSEADASLINFDIPSNYFNSSAIGPDGNYAPTTIATDTPIADFSKPFIGTLASFSSEDWSQVLGTLNESAGGTWLDTANSGLTTINYIQFSVPSSTATTTYDPMYIQAVAGVAPEPQALPMLLIPILALPLVRRRATRRWRNRHHGRA
ncbi:MAG: hypothetical protein ACP5O1_04190 [Phycisphaerae bacterium]